MAGEEFAFLVGSELVNLELVDGV